MAETRRFCTFFLNDRLFGVDVSQVQEAIPIQAITPVPLAPEPLRGLINLRGRVVPMIDVRQRLVPDGESTDVGRLSLVLRTDEGAVSLLIDAVEEIWEVEESSMEPSPEGLAGVGRAVIQGVCRRADRLLFILDINEMLPAHTGG